MRFLEIEPSESSFLWMKAKFTDRDDVEGHPALYVLV
jgi:hypothetical protein